MKSTPERRPAIPGVLIVPLSNLSGKKLGWIISEETLPVPPTISEEHISFIELSIIKPPIPCGPNKLLCPVKASALQFKS